MSGEDFLRNLLTGGVNETKYSGGVTNPMFCNVGTIGIDPRAIGQRIMDIRTALAKVRKSPADCKLTAACRVHTMQCRRVHPSPNNS